MPRRLLLLLYTLVLFQIAIEDRKYQKIRNVQIKKILALALAGCFMMPEITIGSRIFGMFAVSVPMMVVNCIRPGSFGGGDLKLVFACGAFLGDKMLIFGTLGGILAAGIYAVYLLWRKKSKNTRFALGPFLSFGYVSAVICLICKKML